MAKGTGYYLGELDSLVCSLGDYGKKDLLFVGDSYESNKTSSKNSKGKFTMLFFVYRCGHCKKLAPEFEKLASSFKKSKSVLIAKVS